MAINSPFRQLAFAAVLAASPIAASAANCDASTFAEFVTCAAGAATPGDTITLLADVLPDGTPVVPTVDVSLVNNGFQLIGAAGALVKQGAGALVLPAANSYSNGTDIQAGAVVVGDSASLGTGLILLGGGALVGSANVTVGAGNILLNGASTIAAATGTTLTVVNLNVGPAAVATFGVASATGTIDIGAIGTVDVTSNFVLSDGTVRATDGTLGVALATAAATTLGAGVTLDGNGNQVSVANIAGSGQILNPAPGALQIRAGTYGGVISGDGNLDKSTAGVLILTGNNTYTGPTLITGGTLQVGNGGTTGTLGTSGVNNDGDVLVFNRSDAYTPPQPINGTGGLQVLSGTVTLTAGNGYTGGTQVLNGTLLVAGSIQASAFTVADTGGTVGGSGTTGNLAAANNGTISPGTSGPGILNSSTANLPAGTTASFEIAGPTVALQYDQLNVTGNVILGANLNVTGAYTPVLGDTFVLINNDLADAVAGTFAGIPEGTTSTFNGTLMRMSYVGGDGNDVTLSVVSHTVTPGAAGPDGTITPSTPQTVINGGTTSFTIVPNTGYTRSVAGDCPAGSFVGDVYTTGAITANCTVTPVFTQITYTVTPTAGANGSITPNTAQSVAHGNTAVFTVAPDSGFAASVGGTCGGNLVGTTYTTNAITADCTVEATFVALNTFNVVLEGWQQVAPYVITGAFGNGTATFDPVTKQLSLNLTYFGLSSTETMAHIHGPGARGVNAGIIFTLANGSPKTDVVTLDATQEAQLLAGQLYVNIHTNNFPNGELRGQLDNVGATQMRSLTVVKVGNGTVTGTTEAGTVVDCGSNCGENVPHGKVVTLSATPDAGNQFSGWSGACTGTGACMVTMDAAKSVTATFASSTYTVTPSAGANGSMSPSTPQTVNHGATTSFTVTPDSGYAIDTVTGCGGSLAGNTYTTGAITADCTVTATFAVVNPPRLGNISTRSQVGTGNDVMIGGFVIGGSGTKRIAVVATGPSLAAFGITNPLPNPTVRLVRSSDGTTLDSNDDWQAHANSAQLQAAGLAPSHAQEAAILIDLQPGAYTAIVEGVGGTTGVSVIGVYEVDHFEIPLINISTRSRVLTGDDVMIGGFVISGTGPQTVGIVATGPSLGAFGITNPLANPTIRLVRSSDGTTIDTNDDWQAHANSAQLQAAGLAPSDALESGIYTTLPPGAYTVIVEGVGGGTGVGVIGVYRIGP